MSVSDDSVYQFLNMKQSVHKWIEDVLEVSMKKSLEEELSNGIVICYLMQAIVPRSIPRIQENTKNDLKLKENIQFFIGSIEDYGVPKHRLFYVNDLYENRNIVNVVFSLVALAKIASDNGFKKKLVDIPDIKRPDVDQKTMADIKKLLGKVKSEVTTDKNKWKKASSIIRRELMLQVGNNIHLEDYETQYAQIQAIVRGYLSRLSYQRRVRNQAYRDNVVEEIINTEKVYVENLKQCITHFLEPLTEISKKKKPFITEDQVVVLFSNLNMIYSFNCQLFQHLKQRIENWSPYQRIGDIFLKHINFLKCYSTYVQNYSRALALYEEFTKKEKGKFVAFLKEVKEKGVIYDLTSLLILPVQRVPRYNLLLKDLVKHTWKDHIDYEDLVNANNEVEQIALYLNEKEREAVNLKRLFALDELFTGNPERLVSNPSRLYIEEYILKNDKGEDLLVVLCNDMVYIGKDKKEKINYIASYDLQLHLLALRDENSCQITGIGLNLLSQALYILYHDDPQVIQRLVEKANKTIEDLNKKLLDRKIALKEMVGIEESTEQRLLQRKIQARVIKKSLVETLSTSRGTIAERKEKKSSITLTNSNFTRSSSSRYQR